MTRTTPYLRKKRTGDDEPHVEREGGGNIAWHVHRPTHDTYLHPVATTSRKPTGVATRYKEGNLNKDTTPRNPPSTFVRHRLLNEEENHL